MFTSLSANVGFNPLLAGVLACGALPEQCLPQQEEGRKGWKRMGGNPPLKRRGAGYKASRHERQRGLKLT